MRIGPTKLRKHAPEIGRDFFSLNPGNFVAGDFAVSSVEIGFTNVTQMAKTDMRHLVPDDLPLCKTFAHVCQFSSFVV